MQKPCQNDTLMDNQTENRDEKGKRKGNLLLSQCSTSRLPLFIDGLETHSTVGFCRSMAQITPNLAGAGLEPATSGL